MNMQLLEGFAKKGGSSSARPQSAVGAAGGGGGSDGGGSLLLSTRPSTARAAVGVSKKEAPSQQQQQAEKVERMRRGFVCSRYFVCRGCGRAELRSLAMQPDRDVQTPRAIAVLGNGRPGSGHAANHGKDYQLIENPRKKGGIDAGANVAASLAPAPSQRKFSTAYLDTINDGASRCGSTRRRAEAAHLSSTRRACQARRRQRRR